ncbi:MULTISPECIES: energy-coupling factor transporter transmembrane protein EcfT [unclassified Arthrobacter]|uniref:energy-coupling factor transporter transmembrane component T family protein n=1 Tax=unclassified Arthrobacter TaxID=235627 RepID=UPI001E633208|nr:MULTISPECIES: energy-coupling factor transporter transmembrane protein EcfT [unclassified Arthrobacter]MCC9145388.1 energy-coupling factor transporter transmembrane protein EcfT [Arthrobacter sp. zg-Y919]MDK1276616.1 energy-coupling factor transporter transmembrane protein EcfT [Arthrobacter sp. zg.Y919]WIB04434.1 energy-coupling factor transporter transmembrane protein EcfT [Arthrobacter sp. zg-Y919]
MKRSVRTTDLPGAYRPGSSPVHAAPLALKAGALVILSAAVLVLRSPAVLAVAAVLVLTAYASARLLRGIWQPLRMMWPVLVLLGIFQWWTNGVPAAVMVTGSIVVCVLAARLLPLTTAPQVLLDGLVSLAQPLRPLGADPERFGLTLALMLRSIPFLLGSARDVRESAMARGLERNPRALTVPVVIRAVAYARQTGDALAARGIGEASETKVARGNR